MEVFQDGNASPSLLRMPLIGLSIRLLAHFAPTLLASVSVCSVLHGYTTAADTEVLDRFL